MLLEDFEKMKKELTVMQEVGNFLKEKVPCVDNWNKEYREFVTQLYHDVMVLQAQMRWAMEKLNPPAPKVEGEETKPAA